MVISELCVSSQDLVASSQDLVFVLQSTGRGVVAVGRMHTFTRFVSTANDNIHSLTDPDLLGLAEYSCSATVVAERNDRNEHGPPSLPLTIVTLSTGIPGLILSPLIHI